MADKDLGFESLTKKVIRRHMALSAAARGIRAASNAKNGTHRPSTGKERKDKAVPPEKGDAPVVTSSMRDLLRYRELSQGSNLGAEAGETEDDAQGVG